MRDKEKKGWVLGLIIAVIIVLAPMLYQSMTTMTGGHDVEKVRIKIKEELYKEYGQEFIVDRIGLRTANGEEFYQARIYPKAIIGTSKEGDKYYYGKASIEKEIFGLADGVADTYGEINRSIEIEKWLLPKVKELFGRKVLLKVEQRYEKRKKNGYFTSYLNPNLIEVLKRINEEPNNHRLKLELYVYLFNRIEDEKEKEERRKQIFKFIQYLKEESLFDYLEMGVIFIDERVLAPSYSDFKREIYYADTEKKYIEGKTVYLPPLELRKRISNKLQKELEKISEQDLLESMRKIRKSDLTYKKLDKYNASHYGFIYSAGILKVKYSTSYEKHKNNNTLEHYYYKDVSEIKIGKNLEYIYY